MQVKVYTGEVEEVHKWRADHSMTSLGATVVTSWRGISALARMSWALLEPCWMLVRMRVVPPAVAMILSEDPADSIEATTALLEFTPFLFWWVLMCFARWSLRMKRLEHSGQTNFFSPATRKKKETDAEYISERRKWPKIKAVWLVGGRDELRKAASKFMSLVSWVKSNRNEMLHWPPGFTNWTTARASKEIREDSVQIQKESMGRK